MTENVCGFYSKEGKPLNLLNVCIVPWCTALISIVRSAACFDFKSRTETNSIALILNHNLNFHSI